VAQFYRRNVIGALVLVGAETVKLRITAGITQGAVETFGQML
jgi:hypothetical protein